MRNITHNNGYFTFGGVELIEDDEVATRNAIRQLGVKLNLLSTAPHFREVQLTPVWPTADYKFTGRGANLVYQNLDPSSGAGIELYPEPTVTDKDVEFLLYGEGDPDDQTNYERFEFKWDDSDGQFQISSQADGSGTLQPISIFTEGNTDQILLNIDGTININGMLTLDSLLIVHTATENDDHALEIICDAAGFSDVKALDIDYISGDIQDGEDEEIILINIDETAASGGRISAFDVLATEGDAKVEALFVGAGIHPIEQLSGTFANPSSILVKAADQLTALSSGGAGNITLFVDNTDTITVGSGSKFEEMEILLATGASGAGIKPVFEFSTSPGNWTSFGPADGTNAFKNTGVIAWEDADIPTWDKGTGNEYLIRITRTRVSLSTKPICDQIGIAATVEYSWDKDGDVHVKDITTDGDINVGDDIILGSTAAQLNFDGATGGGGEGIVYKDSGGTRRFGLNFLATNKVRLGNRASNGVVEIAANTSTAGGGGEVIVATFQDNTIDFNVDLNMVSGDILVDGILGKTTASTEIDLNIPLSGMSLFADGAINILADNDSSGTLGINLSVAGTNQIAITDGNINMGNLPTSAVGLNAGDIWNNSGSVDIV